MFVTVAFLFKRESIASLQLGIYYHFCSYIDQILGAKFWRGLDIEFPN